MAVVDDINWKVMQTYANYWLKWGVDREAREIEKAKVRARKYRRWLRAQHSEKI